MLFRRGEPDTSAGADASAADGSDLDPAARAPVKGRPTPTRKEAEAARKARVKPQLDRKAAARAGREQDRANRLKTREAMTTGDQRFLPARDQGRVRAFVRDYVDSRRTLGEYMLPALLVFVPLTLFVNGIANVTLRGFLVLATYLYMLLIIVGTAMLGLRSKREAARRFPADEVRGAGLYAAMRSLQLRRWRLPKSRVKPGADLDAQRY